MGWVERIWGSEEPRIPVHQLCASIAEAIRGEITSGDVQTDFNLTTQDFNEIASLIQGAMTGLEIEDILCRAEYTGGTNGRLTGCSSPTEVRTRLGL